MPKQRDLPSLDFLKGFDAAARHLSFTLAAEELYLTQSALSRQEFTVERCNWIPFDAPTQPLEVSAKIRYNHPGTPATVTTPREREICARIGPSLRERGLIFVGIDVIDGYLTEINVTSPTGIRAVSTVRIFSHSPSGLKGLGRK